jgi:quinol monooxygenase YgiN
MFITTVRIFPHPYEKESVRRFLSGLLGPLRVQTGCLDCSLITESHPDALLLTEAWKSEKDLLRRLRSEGYAKVLGAMELSVRKPDVSVYEVINQRGLEFVQRARMKDEIDSDGRADPSKNTLLPPVR